MSSDKIIKCKAKVYAIAGVKSVAIEVAYYYAIKYLIQLAPDSEGTPGETVQ